ncbi:MAG: GGDEF domain-containing protein [Planctomycetota bacterium]
MSAFSATTRAPRARALLVGRSGALDEAARCLTRPPLRADDLFDALGVLTFAPGHEPVTAVLVTSSEAHAAGAAAIAALRRVDPGVRLVVLRETDQPFDRAETDPYDAWLAAPVEPEALERALELEVRHDGGAAAAAPPAPPREPDDEAVPRETPETPAETDDDRAAPEPPAGGREERLGDVDLIEAALHDPDGLAAVALRLAAQETGWHDLAIEPEPPGAEIRYGERRFGWLASRHADEARLGPWAQWLARWLALDRSYRDFRLMAYRDDLTGAWNRRFFHMFLQQAIELAQPRRRIVTVMVFDIDDFKRFNDEYGHEAGDIILRETVRLLNSVIRQGDRVCRIGGDEFAVIFADPEGPREAGSTHPESVEQIAKRFQDQVNTVHFPKLGIDAPGRLSISGGLASYPWDGTDPETLLRRADQLSLLSKRKGKNVITFGPA